MSDNANRQQQIFLAAIEAIDRKAVLDRECAGDIELRKKVEQLLAAHDDSNSLPPVSDLPTLSFDYKPIAEGVGSAIGPYKLKEKVGEGGFGLVFVAEQTEPVRRKVAIKILKPGMDSRQVIARFEAERQALAIMDHPNIAKVLDAGATQSGMPYFVMELVRGIPITEYCDKHQMAPNERLEIFVTVCQAIQHAHQKGIIHRDIKPSNVLVTSHDGKPVVKVIDFGVAKAINQQLTDHSIYTNIATMIGTPLYMSPEQAEMSGLDIDTRSDIYSLGVLLYELLTGSTPIERNRFAKSAFDEIRRLIREEEPPKPSDRLSSSELIASVSAQRHMEPAKLSKLVRGDLDWITMRALEKDRTRRYETATGLARDIQRYLSDEPVEACPPSVIYRLQKFSKKYRVALTTAGGIALLLVVSVVAFAWQARVASDERDKAIEARKAEEDQRKIAENSKEEALKQKSFAETQEAEARRQEGLAREQEAEAKKQAAIAEAVAKFQSDMLASVDPKNLPLDPLTRQPLRDAVTVVQAMNAAVKILDGGSLKDQPLVEASVRNTIGNTLFALTRFYEAEPNLRKAVELRRSALPPGHLDIAKSMNDYAVILHRLNKMDEAEPLFRQALQLRRDGLSAGHLDIAESASNLASLLQTQRKLSEAEPLVREALAIRKAAHSVPHADVADSLQSLAILHAQQRKYAEAKPLFIESLEIIRAALPGKHPSIAKNLRTFGQYLIESGARTDAMLKNNMEAEPLFRESLAINRASLPPQHYEVISGIMGLADTLRNQKKYAEAEPLYREALDLARAVLPVGHPRRVDLIMYINALEYNLSKQNQLSESEQLLREALEISRTAYLAGQDSLRYPSCLNNLAFFLKDHNKLDEAEPLFREALKLSQSKFPAGHPNTSGSLADLGGILLAQGKHDEAEQCLREAVEILNKEDKPTLHTFSTRLMLGGALLGQKKYADAEPLLLDGYKGLKDAELRNPPYVARFITDGLDWLIELYAAIDKPIEVAKWQAEREKYPKKD